jgi:hypothetical protein
VKIERKELYQVSNSTLVNVIEENGGLALQAFEVDLYLSTGTGLDYEVLWSPAGISKGRKVEAQLLIPNPGFGGCLMCITVMTGPQCDVEMMKREIARVFEAEFEHPVQ